MGRLSSLVYQSRAVVPLPEPDLQRLVASAQARNRRELVTGLLIYDQGHFMQWLEGPTEGVSRVWESIRDDRRHTAVTLLAESTIPARYFGNNPMALGKRRGGGERLATRARKHPGEIELPPELIDKLRRSPTAAPSVLAALTPSPAHKAPRPAQSADVMVDSDRISLRALVDELFVPRLMASHSLPLLSPPLIDARSAELARLLVAADPNAAFALIDRLRADGRSITQLCADLFEPAARALGDLWLSDDCSEFDVTLGLGHLQLLLRRASLEAMSAGAPHLPLSAAHAVLVAPSPHEPHVLGSVIASEVFGRAGWDVSCEFPDSDAALSLLVHDRWFDVLDLSLSAAFTREHRLPAMAASIRAAHAHSRNPGLIVIVDGRVFHERPRAFAEVGADAGSGSAMDLVSTAQAQTQLSLRPARPASAAAVAR
jgi:hypothetical protein